MKKNYLKSCLAALALLTAPLSLSALEKADGTYQIGTAADLIEFSNLVNGGEADASAQHGIFIIDGKKVLLK